MRKGSKYYISLIGLDYIFRVLNIVNIFKTEIFEI